MIHEKRKDFFRYPLGKTFVSLETIFSSFVPFDPKTLIGWKNYRESA